MQKDKLIEALNRALQEEYTDVFSYPKEAEKIQRKEIAEEFTRFARMELRHADNVATQINILGGKPKWDFTLLETKESVEEILKQHLQREEAAIQLYGELIKLTRQYGEDQLKLILQGIKTEEELHLSVIKELLKK